jgi:SAM-dependent methyltransferase
MLPLLEAVWKLRVSEVISPDDRMMKPDALHRQHYFYVGRSDLLTVLNVLSIRSGFRGGDAPVTDIFDFGCGHGRVARWFSAAFPHAQIHVTDYQRSGVEFCVEKLGCRETSGEIPRGRFDLVWLGSVFTHLSAQVVEPLLRNLLGSLRPNGVLVFTSQGRYCIERMRGYDWKKDDRVWLHYNIDRVRFETVVTQYHETGYGYVDYPGQKNYGVCIARPTWYSERVLKSDDFIQILFQEKGSDNHQDVSAFMRAPLLDSSKGPLWQLPSQVHLGKQPPPGKRKRATVRRP